MKELAIVIGALVAAIFAAAIIVYLFRPVDALPIAASHATITATVAELPRLELVEEAEVISDDLIRAVPLDILETASVAAAPFNPGIRLKRIVSNPRDWEAKRAEIEDRMTKDVRFYAIGDLLPYGSLLVGISTAAIEVMVGDAHLVRLFADGHIEELHDLSAVYEPAALPLAKHIEPPDADVVRLALIDIRSEDPTVVQAAIDTLISAGDPSLELLVPHAGDLIPVRSAEYAFPSGSAVEMRPRVSGEIVMMVLERITGQTFGDLAKEELSDEERREIAGAWQRFFQ